MAKKRRSAAQKAATRRLVALNKSRRAAPTKAKRRRPNPIRGAVKSRFTAAPRGRANTRRRNPIRRRRNPLTKAGIMGMVRQAAMAATGAVALDYAWANLPIPTEWKVGGLKHAVKGAGAIVLGLLAEKVVNKRTAETMTIGALTVIAHDAMREILGTVAPGVALDGMGYYGAGQVVNGMGEYMSLPAPTMGEYMSQNVSMSPDAMAQMQGFSYY